MNIKYYIFVKLQLCLSNVLRDGYKHYYVFDTLQSVHKYGDT